MSGTGDHNDILRDWLRVAASPRILFYALPWLMILLTAGTVAQKELGIFAAQKIFFSSWVLWWGPLPLPGGYATLGAISLCLLAKFLFHSEWRRDKAGTILAHLGVLVLMIGGLLTAATQKEGYIALSPGVPASAVSDYYARVLSIQKDGEEFASLDFAALAKGGAIDSLPFALRIESTCRNCRPVAAGGGGQVRRGIAAEIALRDAPPEKEEEANLSGLTFSVSGAGEAQDGLYIAMEDIPRHPRIAHGGAVYDFILRRKQTPLPFSIELAQFRREMHPGTDTPRAFSSDIIVRDGDVAWPYTIRMNEPLRYKGYTFYQASFGIREEGDISILSAVRNKGRVFPYLASGIIFAGLLLHLVIRLRGGGKGAA